jgi:YVTN family beta-propeller protein
VSRFLRHVSILTILCVLFADSSHAQEPLFSGHLEPRGTEGFDDWESVGVDFAIPHAGLQASSDRAVWLQNGAASGEAFSQSVDSAGVSYWSLDLLFATKLGQGGDAVQLSLANAGGSGAPEVTILNNGDVAVETASGPTPVLSGIVRASVDADANDSFADAGDTLNVHRLRIIGHDWGTPSARYDLLVSAANVLGGTFAHQVYGLVEFEANAPTAPINDSITEVRFRGALGGNDYVLDDIKLLFGPARPFVNGELAHGASPHEFTGWSNGVGAAAGFASQQPGLVATSTRAAWIETSRTGSAYRFAQQIDSFAADVWTLDFLFASELGGGGEGLQLALGSQSASTDGPIISVRDNGDVAVGSVRGWETIFASAVAASVDADANRSFADLGDTQNVYRMRIVGREWGTPNANYDVYLSDANVPDESFPHRHFGSTSFPASAPTSPDRDTLTDVAFLGGPSSNDYVIDNLSIRYSTQGPGFSQQPRSVGDLIASWDIGGERCGANGRTTIMSVHRGYLMTDTRFVTCGQGHAFSSWDISGLANDEPPREVSRAYLGRPFHAFFMLGDSYTNSDSQTYWDLSDMSDLGRKSISPFIVPDSPEFRDWYMPPYAYIGQDGYQFTGSSGSIFDMSTGAEIAGADNGLDFAAEHSGAKMTPLVIGNLMVAVSVRTGRSVATYDVSDPADPQLLDVLSDLPATAYEPAIYGHYAVMAINGPDHVTFVDFSDPSDLRLAHTIRPAPGRNRYLQFQDRFMFVGDAKYDISDIQNPVLVHEFDGGDEYLLPLGNMVVIASLDGVTRVFAHQAAPDTAGPIVTYNNPVDGSVGQAVTSRIGVVIPETLEPSTIHSDSFIVRPTGGAPIAGTLAFTDKDVINFSPTALLLANTTYEVELVAGGISDVSGNSLAEAHTFEFTTGNEHPNAAVITALDASEHPAPIGTPVTLRGVATDPDEGALRYRWDFGDGSFSDWTLGNDQVEHTYQSSGHYTVVLQVEDDTFAITTETIVVTVIDPPVGPRPVHSTPILVDELARRVWVVNPDNDTVVAIDADTHVVLFEVEVGAGPVSLTQAHDDTIWVSCERADRIDVLDSESGSRMAKIELRRGARPHGLVTDPKTRKAFVALQDTAEIARFSTAARTESRLSGHAW